MSDKLKKLHIKKLIQEYEFLTTENEYLKEIVEKNKINFLEITQEHRKKINKPISDVKEKDSVNMCENAIKPENVSESTKNKVKKIYREIVKLTHPDKTNSEEMIEVYRNATNAANNYNIIDLFQICIQLGIHIELDTEDVDVLNFLIKTKKDDIIKIESSFIWLWINAKDDNEKNNIIKMFIEQT